jgi:hypothetical protein
VIEELAQAKCKGVFSTSSLMLELSKAQIIEQRYNDKILSFEEWSSKQEAA